MQDCKIKKKENKSYVNIIKVEIDRYIIRIRNLGQKIQSQFRLGPGSPGTKKEEQ